MVVAYLCLWSEGVHAKTRAYCFILFKNSLLCRDLGSGRVGTCSRRKVSCKHVFKINLHKNVGRKDPFVCCVSDGHINHLYSAKYGQGQVCGARAL